MRFSAACLIIVGLSMAFTLHVPEEYTTIQSAINAAADGDTVLVSPGTYTENVDYLGKAIVLTSAAGPTFTTIRSVVINNTPNNFNTVLDGFTVCSNNSQTGIQCVNTNVTITGNNITQNWAYMFGSEGSGIQCNASSQACPK